LAKLKLTPGVVTEAVPCGGRIDPRYILKAFESGAGAVCVLTCPVGSCRLMEGNLRATCRVGLAKELLAEAGLDAGCVQFFMPGGLDAEAIEEAMENVARFIETGSKAQVERTLPAVRHAEQSTRHPEQGTRHPELVSGSSPS
jgi:coenzyme F420-reducing hydrogenase delta subunit